MVELITRLIQQFDISCIVNHSSMHNKQPQIELTSALHKHIYTQYHMHSIVSSHSDLPTILIHQLDISFIINHLCTHIKKPKIVLVSAMHKHDPIQYHIHPIASTHIDLLAILIRQFNITFKDNHSSS